MYSLVRHAHVQGPGIRVGVNSNSLNAKPFARLHDANGDLAAIGNEDFVEQLLARHLRLGGACGALAKELICGSGRPTSRSAICDIKY